MLRVRIKGNDRIKKNVLYNELVIISYSLYNVKFSVYNLLK